MFLYYIELIPAPDQVRELHRADCWYLLRQNLSKYKLLGCFEHYGLAESNAQMLKIYDIKKCPFCSV